MSFLSDLISGRGKLMAAYKRGMQKAKDRDLAGAIEDYTSILQSAKADADLKAMAMLNRGLAYSTNRDFDSARSDLEAVVAMPGVPANIVSAAETKLKRMTSRLEKSTGDDD